MVSLSIVCCSKTDAVSVTGLPITVSDLALQIKPWVRDVWIRNIKTVGFNQMVVVNVRIPLILICSCLHVI